MNLNWLISLYELFFEIVACCIYIFLQCSICSSSFCLNTIPTGQGYYLSTCIHTYQKFIFAIADPNTLMYAIQQQALGSIQWTIIVSSLKDPCYTVTSCSKGVCYAFRVLSITTKAFSKPSPSTDPVQLVNRGMSHQSKGNMNWWHDAYISGSWQGLV
jgi:hypothetical protein